jgi:hypothetical protein
MDRIMTALRRQRTGLAAVLGFVLAGTVLTAAQGQGGAPGDVQGDSVTERVVTDEHSGLAIYGFDPVSYFTNGVPRLGSPDFEYRAEDVIWRFRNQGNRAAFAASAHVYRPRFGGYDPVAIGRGVATAGHPEIWTIAENRLYLFYNEDSKAKFLADPGGAVALADQKWAEVLRTLVP